MEQVRVSMDIRKSKRFAETKFISGVRRTVGAIRVLTGRVIKQVPREGEGGAILWWVPLTPGQWDIFFPLIIITNSDGARERMLQV